MKPIKTSIALLGLVSLSAQTQLTPVQPPIPAPVVDSLPTIATELIRSYGLVEGLQTMGGLHAEQRHFEARYVGRELLGPGIYASWLREQEAEGESWWLSLLQAGDPLLDALRLSGLHRRERAHVHYALGVVAHGSGERELASTEFKSASARSGVGSLRQDATYNLGTLELEQGEEWRAQLPELGGTPPAAPASPGPSAPGAKPEKPPEPLAEARKAYLAAKHSFSLRLRMDWDDPDTRANTELVMRRLRELDEIERQREEQEQQEGDEDQEPNEDQEQQENEGDPSESGDQSDEESQDPQEEQDPAEEQEQPDEEEEEEPQDPEQEQSESEGEDPQQGEAEQQEPQEIFLTKEEVQRLLDRLRRHEERGEKMRERRRAHRRPMARDW